jgi:hypothetical protein
MGASSMMLRILFVGLFVLSCIIETQHALFEGGKSMQKVRNIDEYSLLTEYL